MDGKYAKLSPFQVDPDKIPQNLNLTEEDFRPAADEEKASMAEKHKGVSYWKDAWRRFRKNTVSMVALGVFFLCLLFAFVGPKLIPYSYQSSTIPKIVDKTFDGILYSGHELGLDLVKNITDACTMLNCSADVLLGLTSSSGQVRDRAEWVLLDAKSNKWACDHCGYVEWSDQYPADDGYLYCSGCGRDMRKEAEHETD